MVDKIYVVVNVMLPIMSAISPHSYLVQLISAHCCEVMCVMNKQFELLEFAFDSVYVDPQYEEISLTFTAWSVCLCGVCSPVVVFSLYVGAVVALGAVTVMHVLLFVLHVCMLREC